MTPTLPHDDDADRTAVVIVPPLPGISAADAATRPAAPAPGDAVPPPSESVPPKPDLPADVAAAQFAPEADGAAVVARSEDSAPPADDTEPPAPRSPRVRMWVRRLVPARGAGTGSDAVTSDPAPPEPGEVGPEASASLEETDEPVTIAVEEIVSEETVPEEIVPEDGAPRDGLDADEPAADDATVEDLVARDVAENVPTPTETPRDEAPEESGSGVAAIDEADPVPPASVQETAVAGAPDVADDDEEPAVAFFAAAETAGPASVDAAVNAAAVGAAATATSHAVDGGVPALRLTGVTKSFGATHAVAGVDLAIRAGTFYGIVGPNGAGKTTTLSMIAGLLQPDAGRIEIAGIDLAAEPVRAKALIGVLPDRLRTFDRLTGRQLLHYYGVLRGVSSAVVEGRVTDLARAFDVADALARPVADYSAGMTKKLMLAGAMIHAPRLLVLDEPFESVDPVSSAVILDILGAYVAHGGTVVLTSHGMELVERVCSGVAVIVAGRILAEGTVDEVRGTRTLEQRFVELAGGVSDVEGLEWLHTFSG